MYSKPCFNSLCSCLWALKATLLLKHGQFSRRSLQPAQFLGQLATRCQSDDFIANLCRQFVNHVVRDGHRSVVNQAFVANLEQKKCTSYKNSSHSYIEYIHRRDRGKLLQCSVSHFL